jgi:oligoendopeptidase F
MVSAHKRYSILTALILCVSLVAFATTLSAQNKPKTRAEIPAKYKWNLADVYPNWQAWESDMTLLEKKIGEFAALQGTLSRSSGDLLKAYGLFDEIQMLAIKTYRYPQLTRDTDMRDNVVSAKFQQFNALYAKLGTASAWFNPEQLSIGWAKVEKWLAENAELRVYRYPLEDLYRTQKHVLSEEGERLLSYFSTFSASPSTCYDELTTSDIKFPTVTLSNGEQVTLSPEQYGLVLENNHNQQDRRLCWQNSYGVYNANANTHAALYNAVCQKDWAYAQARNYPTTLDAALDVNNVPTSVYHNLIASVKNGSAPLQRYYQLRKKALKLESYHLYDGSLPVVEFKGSYDYDSLLPMLVESVAPLGKDYQEMYKKAVYGGWVDVYESEGKASGAYSAGTYGVHPFILTNYNGTLEASFTMAHELGHSMHTMLSQKYQPYTTSQYTIFAAEVASTLNEALFLDYKLAHSKDPKERIRLLEQSIDNIDGTYYTQAVFADFEYRVHSFAERGEPITADGLKELLKQMWGEYYGTSVEYEDLYGMMWSRISHFFDVPYYVYQYATSFAASAKIHEDIISKDPKVRNAALDRYLTLLKSGGNDYPMEQLKKAGVDLSQPATMQAVVTELDRLVTLLDAELKKLN